MSQPGQATLWILRDGMPLTRDAALDVLHTRVLSEEAVDSDAIVWLQGNRYDRGPKALELFTSRRASTIVITGNDVRGDETSADDGIYITVTDLTRWLLDRGVPTHAIVAHDIAMHTRDQASHILALATERGWKTLLLVASPHHQLRAFLTFLRAAFDMGWNGRIVNQPAAIPWDAVPSGRRQTSECCFVEEREKIVRYRDHVASIVEGLQYFEHPNHTTEGGHSLTTASVRTEAAWEGYPGDEHYAHYTTHG